MIVELRKKKIAKKMVRLKRVYGLLLKNSPYLTNVKIFLVPKR